PLAMGLRGGVDRLRDVLSRSLVPVAQDVAVVVRHHRLRLVPGADLLASDDERDVEALARHGLEPRLELRLLGGPGAVGLDGLVDRRRHPPDAVETGVAHGRPRVSEKPARTGLYEPTIAHRRGMGNEGRK